MILVGIPAYNEAQHIENVLRRTVKYADRILVVDDGSKDATAELARAFGVTVISHPKNRGLGATINTILRYARDNMTDDDILITMDSDEQHNPEDIPRLVAKIQQGYDVVTGSRLYNKKAPGPTPARRVMNGMATYITRMMCGFRVYTTDSQSGYHAFRAWFVRRLRLKNFDYGWNSELFLWAHKLHARCADVSVWTVWTPPSTSAKKHATLSYGIKALWRLSLIWIEARTR